MRLEYVSSEILWWASWEIYKIPRPNGTAHGVCYSVSYYIDGLRNPLVELTFRKVGLVLGDPEHDGHSANYFDLAIWFKYRSQPRHSKLDDTMIELAAKGPKLNEFPDHISKL